MNPRKVKIFKKQWKGKKLVNLSNYGLCLKISNIKLKSN